MIDKQIEKPRYPITNDFREALIKSMMKIIVDPTKTSTEKTAAGRVIVAAEALNQSAERDDEKW